MKGLVCRKVATRNFSNLQITFLTYVNLLRECVLISTVRSGMSALLGDNLVLKTTQITFYSLPNNKIILTKLQGIIPSQLNKIAHRLQIN